MVNRKLKCGMALMLSIAMATAVVQPVAPASRVEAATVMIKEITKPSDQEEKPDTGTTEDPSTPAQPSKPEETTDKEDTKEENDKKNTSKKKVQLNKKKAKLKVGQKLKLKVKNTKKKITWTSRNPKIAKVNKKGVVTARKAGSAVIRAKVKGGKTYKCRITVKKAVSSKKSVKKK